MMGLSLDIIIMFLLFVVLSILPAMLLLGLVFSPIEVFVVILLVLVIGYLTKRYYDVSTMDQELNNTKENDDETF